MPTYGYKCQKCNHEFEVLQKMSDDPVTVCPTCDGPVKRVFHPVGIIFKGSGFYTTDYKRQPNPAAPAKPANGDSSSKSNEKADKKDSPKKNPTQEKTAK